MRGQAKMAAFHAPCDNECCANWTKRQVKVPQKRINQASKKRPRSTYSVFLTVHRCMGCDS